VKRSDRAGLAGLPGFRIGITRWNYLEVRIVRRSHPGADDVDDADWVSARVLAATGGFRADYDAHLMSSDFARYRHELARLSHDRAGTTRLQTLEEWIDVGLAYSDSTGHLEATCEITDHPGMGARLRFKIDLLPSDLGTILRDLDEVVSAYPAPKLG